MTKGSSVRNPAHPIEALFLDRWSPRSMSGQELPLEELQRLFEAARWAPSSYNNQPWRMLFARRGTEYWERFLGLLAEANRKWCEQAAALVVFVSKTTFDYNGKPSPTHSYDCGSAWENFALQGASMGLVVHGMQGFDYERAKNELNVPEGFKVEAMAAVGWPGPAPQDGPEKPNDRRPLVEIALEGVFPTA